MASLNQALEGELNAMWDLSSLERSDALDHIQQSGHLQLHYLLHGELVKVARIIGECLATSQMGMFVQVI